MDDDGMPTAQELYAAGALSNRMPTAAELMAQTGGPSPWEDTDYEAVPMTDDDDGDPEKAPGTAANLSLLPTATTDPKRPRTLAAGYDKNLQTLTVMFRDNTLYNYYEVDSLTWANFKRARSKGRFILAYLDDHPRGYPTEGAISALGRTLLNDVAREYQIAQGGMQPGHSAKSKRGMRPYRRTY